MDILKYFRHKGFGKYIIYLHNISNITYELKHILFKRDGLVLRAYVDFRNGTLRTSNWGDDLNFYLIELISHKHIVFKNKSIVGKLYKNNYACIGSIVEWLIDKKSIVWGAGACGASRMNVLPQKVLAVRGPMTRDFLLNNGVDCPPIYGDPALLLPRFYKPKTKRVYRMGIIPHVVDSRNKFVKLFKEANPDVQVVDLAHYDCWTDVIDQIVQCDFVISSSLHGLIVSDAYQVPNVWVKFSDKLGGDDFKFKDYFKSVGRNTSAVYRIERPLDFYTLQTLAKEWRPIQIDLEPLWKACPFKAEDK